ncbi:SDR family oxidoreductase [Kiritimatiellota bacterium B12222]|nr:SDR family oxidoreductase [Kiritimatiellota bacterium B12222]
MTHSNSTTTLILGATSAMAEHSARLLATDGDALFLAARNPEDLAPMAEDLKVRGASAVTILPAFDALKPDTFADIINQAAPFDRVLIAHGSLPDQEDCQDSLSKIKQELQINFQSTVDLCTLCAEKFIDQGSGTLAVISSVAGLRGRQSNYIYGAAKGGLNTFLQGLRNRLQTKGIRVITLLPGFVDTPMTADIKKGPLFISAEQAGICIHKAITKSKSDIVYVPSFWRFIMWIIRSIPEPIFKRLKL